MTPFERYRGSLLGLAAGDALGTTLEFKPPGTFKPIDDMVGGGPFGLKPGQWTDDTSMALCLAESLVDRGGFDPVDQLQRYVKWWRRGYLSSNGVCFDIAEKEERPVAVPPWVTATGRCGQKRGSELAVTRTLQARLSALLSGRPTASGISIVWPEGTL